MHHLCRTPSGTFSETLRRKLATQVRNAAHYGSCNQPTAESLLTFGIQALAREPLQNLIATLDHLEN